MLAYNIIGKQGYIHKRQKQIHSDKPLIVHTNEDYSAQQKLLLHS